MALSIEIKYGTRFCEIFSFFTAGVNFRLILVTYFNISKSPHVVPRTAKWYRINIP